MQNMLVLLMLCLNINVSSLSLTQVSQHRNTCSRRSFIAKQIATLSVATTFPNIFLPSQAKATESLADLKSTVQQARKQLDAVPAIIEKQEWDKVRAILITPPLSDFWTTTKKGKNILMDIASAVGDAGGDELSVLEEREEVQSHLRYLDMAVYNNVFNPISREGETGATKQLIKSYYEDPKNELKASQDALDRILAEMQ